MKSKIETLFTLIAQLANSPNNELFARALSSELQNVSIQDCQYIFGLERCAHWKCSNTNTGMLVSLLGSAYESRLITTQNSERLFSSDSENLNTTLAQINKSMKSLYLSDQGSFFVYSFKLPGGILTRGENDKKQMLGYAGHEFVVIQYRKDDEVRYRLFQSFLNFHFHNNGKGNCHVEGLSYSGYPLRDYLYRVKLNKTKNDFSHSDFEVFWRELENFAFSSNCEWDDKIEKFHQQYFDCESGRVGFNIQSRNGIIIKYCEGKVDETLALQASLINFRTPPIKLISNDNEGAFAEMLGDLERCDSKPETKLVPCFFSALPPRWREFFGVKKVEEQFIQKLLLLSEVQSSSEAALRFEV